MIVTKEELERLLVAEIERLSQQEGLFDEEIAVSMQLSRATVNRKRQRYNIPRANLEMRNDKQYTCKRCIAAVTVRRSDRKTKYCPVCRDVVDAEILERRKTRQMRKAG